MSRLLCAFLFPLVLSMAAVGAPPVVARTILPPDPDLAEVQVAFRDRDRRLLDVWTDRYRLEIDLERGCIGGLRPVDVADGGLEIRPEIRTDGGRFVAGPGTGRVNIDRFGPVMYEIHVRDLRFVPASAAPGDRTAELPVWPDLAVRAWPDRVHVEFGFIAEEPVSDIAPRLVFGHPDLTPDGPGASQAEWFAFADDRGDGDAGISVVPLGPGVEALRLSDGSTAARDRSVTAAPCGRLDRGGTASVLAAVIPASTRADGDSIAHAIAEPLSADAFTVDGGVCEGFDPAWGAYSIRTDWSGPRHFEIAHVNPGGHVRVDVEVRNDNEPRDLYLRVHNTYGCLEAAVATDRDGLALAEQIQVSKNFGGEKEEGELEGDAAFGESVHRLRLDAGARFSGRILHLFGDWGRHPVKQISSIRFYRHYFHCSTGPTETICTSPFPFPRGPEVTYSLADVRGMSLPTWPGQPQHDHTSVIGLLRYRTANGWIHPRLTRTSIYQTGPLFARFAMEYVTDDEAAHGRVEIFEMPQADQTRCFLRMRWEIDRPIEPAGPLWECFRLIHGGAYIVGTVHDRVSWIDPDGVERTVTVPPNGSAVVRGEPLARETPFVAAWPNEKGNLLFLVRRWEARLDGRDAPPAVTAIGRERFTEVFLTAPDGIERLRPGDYIDAEIVVVPYGPPEMAESTPRSEREHYGPSGPSIEVALGELVEEFPWRVRVNENGVADVRVGGGLDRQALIIEGLSERRRPMLWEDHGGWFLVDPAVDGDDGVHFYRAADGSVGAVFVVHTRPGQRHRYVVCEPPGHGPVRAVRTRNGRVVVSYADEPDVVLTRPPGI